MRSSKQAAAAAATATENNRGISGHMFTLHQRLYHALNLGTRYSEGKEWKWKCTDIEIQRHVVRSISSFIESASPDTLHHPLVKDSVADIVWALVWILQHKSEAVLSIAANMVVKLIRIIPNSILQPYSLYLVHPLAPLLSSRRMEVSIACATALNMILSNLSATREKSVWEILSETKTVFLIVSGIREFSGGPMATEYFQEMASLLSTILQKWSASRFSVWNDTKLMEVLEAMHENPDVSIKVALLKLYSGIALCGNGAMKLLQNGEALLQMMVLCMGRSRPLSVQMEGFRLAQHLATNKQGCLKMLSLCCEPIVKAIIDGMTGWTLSSGKIANDQMSLLVEACRLALIIRWDGEHHDYFWKKGIDKVLLDLLLEKFHNGQSVHLLTLEEQMSEAQEALKADVLLVLRPYMWDILGWLAIYCREDFNPNIHSHELLIDMLIRCACLTFTDSVRKGWQICQSDLSETFRSESASRAVLMMIYSPCKYIASKARSLLSEILKPTGKEYLKHSLRVLNFTLTRDNFGIPDMLQTGINLVALTCCACFPWYRSYIVKSGGVKTLLAFIKWCLSNDVHIGRLSFAPHLHNIFSQRLCCWVCKEDWEGNDILLLYGLWGLAELLHYGSISKNVDIFSGQVEYTEAQFVRMLQEICSDNSALGLKWNAAYILSYFGFYGFPCKLGRRIGKALDENEFADTRIILAKGESMSVHGVVLAIRCPSLLPPEELSHDEKASDGSSGRCAVDKQYGKFKKDIRLSSHVDNQALSKLLKFVYLGYLHAGDEHVKKLNILAKHCSLQPLSTMLGRRRPKWGTLFPIYDLTPALAPTGHHFSYGLLLDLCLRTFFIVLDQGVRMVCFLICA
uniref:At1g04390 ARM repeat domain-containing protein n=1 Tax=Populus davidiana TaxID=266767 RepID=A0A6M2F225_9ROSI